MFPTLSGKMNHLLVFGVILMCCHAAVIETNVKPQLIDVVKFLEKFKDTMKKGDDKLGLPVLDPLIKDQLPIKLDEEQFKLDALLTNLKVDDLSKYDVLSGDFNLMKLTFKMNLSWPLVAAKTDYAMVGSSESFEIYGKGKINLSAHDFIFGTEIALKVKGLHLQVKSIKSAIFLRALDFVATGLFNDEELSELISAMVSDMVPQLINDYQEQIVAEVNEIITNLLNGFLADKTIGDLLKLLG